MNEDHEVCAPLIIAIDDVKSECRRAHSDATTDNESALGDLEALDVSLLVQQGSPRRTPRRRPGANVSQLGEDDDDDDDDEDDSLDVRHVQPPLALEMHWTLTVLIQMLTAGVALAIICGIHEFFHAENTEVTVIFVFGALLLGGFWTASGFALPLKRSPANKPIQVVLLVAPLVYLLLVPLVVIASLPAGLLLLALLGMLCYICGCLPTNVRPKIVCIRTYRFTYRLLLFVQFALSILFWFGCAFGYWEIHESQDADNLYLALLNLAWMLFVRSLLFLDARVYCSFPQSCQ